MIISLSCASAWVGYSQGYLLFHGNSRVRLLVGGVRLMVGSVRLVVGCSLLLFLFFFLLIALVLFLFVFSSYCGVCMFLSCFFLVFFCWCYCCWPMDT